MGFIKFLGKARKVIGKLTDLLIRGRQAGLWTENQGIGSNNMGTPHDPAFPTTRFLVTIPQKPPVKATRVAWLVAIVGLLGYEGYTLMNSVPGDTLSEAVWGVAGDYPLLPFLAGIVSGHFFWQKRNVR